VYPFTLVDDTTFASRATKTDYAFLSKSICLSKYTMTMRGFIIIEGSYIEACILQAVEEFDFEMRSSVDPVVEGSMVGPLFMTQGDMLSLVCVCERLIQRCCAEIK
jgi:hypothetical protein